MPKPIHITAPPPTLEELEKLWRIPKARKKELQALVDKFKAQLTRPEESPVTAIGPEKRRKRASAA